MNVQSAGRRSPPNSLLCSGLGEAVRMVRRVRLQCFAAFRRSALSRSSRAVFGEYLARPTPCINIDLLRLSEPSCAQMGQRREPRTESRFPVRIFGTDAEGKVFSENVFTVDISRAGARLSGVRARIKTGEIVGISHGANKSRFTVKWIGSPGTAREGQIGVQNITPEKNVWDVVVPTIAVDTYTHKPSLGSERRQHPRMKCSNSIQLHPEGQAAPIWGKAMDLSTGGCFVEMPMPLPRGTKLRIGLWLNETKLLLTGKVVNSRPGFGVGIQFIEMLPQDGERLRQFLKSITQLRS
jgi:hypothetical protein